MFTHIDENGDANMVDVTKKNDTLREAVAQGSIILNKEIKIGRASCRERV